MLKEFDEWQVNKRRAIQILREARDLIRDPWCWEQGYFARDERDMPTSYWDKHAESWCAEGALCLKASVDKRVKTGAYMLALAALTDSIPGDWDGRRTVHAWQDARGRRHEEVIRLFNRAIERLS